MKQVIQSSAEINYLAYIFKVLIQLFDEVKELPQKREIFDSVYGALFFGVPNHGMKIESLIPMVEGQPNRGLLHSIDTLSQQLSEQSRQFKRCFVLSEAERHKSRIFCFYETKKSPTACKVRLSCV